MHTIYLLRYVLKNHSVKTIAKKLINCLNEAQFSFNDIDKYLLRKNLIRKLLNVENVQD